MILDTPKERVVTNANKESNLEMETSAEAFAIMSDSIYEHKIAAVVRELTCNAFDSHVDAGKGDVPIHVSFPTVLDPYFSVTDEGIGLDDDEVRKVFLVYFKSLKRNTNEQTGFLGLGSKSPMAYTNSFLIRARKDGVEREYACYIGDDDRPKVNMMYESQTDQHNGVRVSVPVQVHDFDRFVDEARFIFSFFDVVPDTNLADFEVVYPDALSELKNEGSYLLPKPYLNSSLYQCDSSSLFVNMGNVCYRVSKRELFGSDQDNDELISFFNRNIASFHGYIIRVPMGSVKFQASRERLSLKEHTIEYLQSLFLADATRMLDEAHEHFASFESPMEVYADELARRFPNSKTFKACGRTLAHWFVKRTNVFSHTYTCRMTEQKGYDRTTNQTIQSKLFYNHLANGNYTVLYYTTNSRGIVMMSRELAKGYGCTAVISIHDKLTEHKVNRLKALFPSCEFVCLEDLMAERRKENGGSESRSPIKKEEIDAVCIASDGLTRKDRLDLNDSEIDYYYVENTLGHAVSDGDWLNIGGNTVASITNISDLAEYYSGETRIRILVTTAQSTKKAIRNDVPHVSELVERLVSEVEGDEEFKQYSSLRYINRSIRDSLISTIGDVYDIIEGLSDDTVAFMKFKTEREEEQHEKYRTLHTLYRLFVAGSASDDIDEKVNKIHKDLQNVLVRYPLLKAKDDVYPFGAELLQHWRDYVMMVNTLEGEKEND